MHSIEDLRWISDRAALKARRQYLDASIHQLRDSVTGEISCDRMFVDEETAREFCQGHGAELVPAP